MTDRYVSKTGTNSGAGGAGAPWETFAYAAANSSAGDTIYIKGGTYNRSGDTITITKNNQIWTAATNEEVIIDGGYGPSQLTNTNGKWLIPHPRTVTGVRPNVGTQGYITAGLITVAAGVTGVTISNLKIRNSAGSAIRISETSNNTTIDGCVIDFTYAGSIQASGSGSNTLSGFTIKNCTITRSSVRKFTNKSRFCENHKPDGTFCAGPMERHDIDPKTGNPYWPAGGKESVDVTIKPKYSTGALVEKNLVAFTFGEGIAAAAGSNNITIQDNVVHNTDHWPLGINCSQNVTMRRNIVYVDGTLPEIWNSTGGITIGDENDLFNDTKQHSENLWVYNNLVVGMKSCFLIRGGASTSYNTVLKNAYFGYNTFVGAPPVNGTAITEKVVWFLTGSQGQDHQSVLFENNVIIRNGATALIAASSSLPNCVFRNNAFSDTQAQVSAVSTAMANGAGSKFGATVVSSLVAPGGPRTVTGFGPNISNAAMETLLAGLSSQANAFKATNYHLVAGSTLIGAGANHSPQLGIRPIVRPTETPPLTPTADPTDYLKNSRSNASGGYFDIGFFEIGGTSSSVVPSFTQKLADNSAAAGDIVSGTKVTFTDTSTVPGGVTAKRYWDFDGDNTVDLADAGSPVEYTFTTPGDSFTPTLRLTTNETGTPSYVATGAALRVVGGSGTGVYIDTISKTLTANTAGTVNFDFTLGNNVPKLVVFTMTAATSATANSSSDNAMLCHGFAGVSAGVIRQYAGAIYSADNVDPTAAGRQQIDNGCLLAVDSAGTQTGRAYVAANGFSSNRVTVTIDNTAEDKFDAAYIVTATAYGGAGVDAAVGTGLGPAKGATTTIQTGFVPGLFCLTTVNQPGFGSGNAGPAAVMSIGYATSTTNQYYARWHQQNNRSHDALTTTPEPDPEANVGRGIAYRNLNSTPIVMSVSAITAGGVTLQSPTDNYANGFGWYALKVATNLDLQLVKTATAVGNQDVTLGWQPGHIQAILTGVEATGSDSATWLRNELSTMSTHFTLHTRTGSTWERGMNIGARSGAGASNKSNTSSRVIDNSDASSPKSYAMSVLRSYTGAATEPERRQEARASFLSTGYRIAWTTVDGINRAWLVVAIRTTTEASQPGPVVNFKVTSADGGTAAGYRPFTAYLTDLTNGNGNTISSYNIDWGDGNTDTFNAIPTTAKTHQYIEAGIYDVTVTCVGNSGTGTLTISSAVTVNDAAGDQIIGPILPDTLTEETDNEVDLDINSNTRGMHTHALEFGAIKLSKDYSAAGKTLTADGARWQIAVINGELKVMSDTGRMGVIPITWDAGTGEPPSGNSGTVSVQVNQGIDNGDEISDGTVTLNSATTVRLTAGTQWGAIRFRNVTVPQNATIQSATLSVFVANTSNDTPNAIIYGNKAGNAAELSDAAYGISNLARTTKSVTWNATDIGADWRDAPSVVDIIQELVNQATWSSGNAMTLIFDGVSGTTFQFRTYGYDTTKAAKLSISWVK